MYINFFHIELRTLKIKSVNGSNIKECSLMPFAVYSFNYWTILLNVGKKQNTYHFAGCEKCAYMNSCFQNLKIHFNGSLNLYLNRLNFFVHLHAKNRIFKFTIKMWPNKFSSLKNDVLRFYWWLFFQKLLVIKCRVETRGLHWRWLTSYSFTRVYFWHKK